VTEGHLARIAYPPSLIAPTAPLHPVQQLPDRGCSYQHNSELLNIPQSASSSYCQVLIFYCSISEQKIDNIASRIDGITLLLQGLNAPSDTRQPEAGHILHPNQAGSVEPVNDHHPICAPGGEHQWDHPIDIIDFVKAVVDDRGSRDVGPEADELLSSLRKLVQTLERPATVRTVPFLQSKVVKPQAGPSMPPLEAVVEVLRWAKGTLLTTRCCTNLLTGTLDHEAYTRITWISQILPLQKFTDICRKVYFAVDDYSEVDLILTNAYLSYTFSEHVIVSGRQDYRAYCCLCRENLDNALAGLPLLLPASMEVIAVLTLGVCISHR
jgi:hypothetical protein